MTMQTRKRPPLELPEGVDLDEVTRYPEGCSGPDHYDPQGKWSLYHEDPDREVSEGPTLLSLVTAYRTGLQQGRWCDFEYCHEPDRAGDTIRASGLLDFVVLVRELGAIYQCVDLERAVDGMMKAWSHRLSAGPDFNRLDRERWSVLMELITR